MTLQQAAAWIVKRRVGLSTYVLCQAGLLFWWIALYPGLFSPDTFSYIWQATTSNWATHHSVAYTALVWLSLQLTGGVAALTLAQTIAAAAGLAYIVTGLRAIGGSSGLALIVAIVLTFFPSVGTLMTYVWKDTAFAIAQLFVVGTIARIVAARRRDPARQVPRYLYVLLTAEFTLVALFRQNGFEVVAIAAVLAAVVLLGQRLRLLAAGGIAAAVALVANLVVYPALGVRDEFLYVGSETLYADIAIAYATVPSTFTTGDKALMSRVASLDHWRKSANCYDTDATLRTGDFRLSVAKENNSELTRLWQRVAKRTPSALLDARICRGSLAWRVFTPDPKSRSSRTGILDLDEMLANDRLLTANPFRSAVYSAPLDKSAHRLAVWIVDLGRAHTFEALVYRGATWAYLSYLAVALVARRQRNRDVLALVGIVAGTQIAVLLQNPVQSSRYMLGPLIIGMLLTTLALAPRQAGAEAVTQAGGEAPGNGVR